MCLDGAFLLRDAVHELQDISKTLATMIIVGTTAGHANKGSCSTTPLHGGRFREYMIFIGI